MTKATENFKIQKLITAIIAVLFIIKFIAWYFTNSVAILTDTLEYTINVISGLIGLYSLRLSSLPRDANHPYGHGKVEFISATIEGTLMIVSSFVIIYEAVINLENPHEIKKLDYGIYLVAFTAIINFAVGFFSVKMGKKNHSLALVATGKHMQSDTYATVGIVIGLILIHFTRLSWIDSAVAIVFALIIVVSGYKILRTSIAGIMDEADEELLQKLVKKLNNNRNEEWIDLHNLRIIKYGGVLHLDCHLTVPWYLNVYEAHKAIDALALLIKQEYGDSIELFVHTDGCMDFSCCICSKPDCGYRKKSFEKKIEWTMKNISTNAKHRLE